MSYRTPSSSSFPVCRSYRGIRGPARNGVSRKGGLIFFRFGSFGGSVYLAKRQRNRRSGRNVQVFKESAIAACFGMLVLTVLAAAAFAVSTASFEPRYNLAIQDHGRYVPVTLGLSFRDCSAALFGDDALANGGRCERD